jgi:hypothetical protein
MEQNRDIWTYIFGQIDDDASKVNMLLVCKFFYNIALTFINSNKWHSSTLSFEAYTRRLSFNKSTKQSISIRSDNYQPLLDKSLKGKEDTLQELEVSRIAFIKPFPTVISLPKLQLLTSLSLIFNNIEYYPILKKNVLPNLTTLIIRSRGPIAINVKELPLTFIYLVSGDYMTVGIPTTTKDAIIHSVQSITLTSNPAYRLDTLDVKYGTFMIPVCHDSDSDESIHVTKSFTINGKKHVFNEPTNVVSLIVNDNILKRR